jgi:hypothetical protein
MAAGLRRSAERPLGYVKVGKEQRTKCSPPYDRTSSGMAAQQKVELKKVRPGQGTLAADVEQ